LTAFNIIGVIDLCAGEGACALACYRKALPYVGVTFNTQHSARLLAHLETVVLRSMTTAGDPLYNVSFADAVQSESAGASGGSSSSSSSGAAPNPHRAHQKPDPGQQQQPDDDPVTSERAMSGDDN
jgi:hypothetical protein